MKNILAILGICLVPSGLWAENTISMVTYFPIPYVAYSKINVQKQLDVGVASVCEMNLGCNESGAAGLIPLRATNVYLNKGELHLNQPAAAIASTTVNMGTSNGASVLNFDDSVRINTMTDGYSVEADQMNLEVLKLFPDRIKNNFPSCASTGADGAPQMSWKKLRLKGADEIYLACGTAKEVEADCSNTAYKQAHKSECCPGVSVSDSICYKDCPGESTFSWGDSGNTVEGWMGSDWKVKSCSRKASNNSTYGYCIGTPGHYVNDEYPCWKGPAVAASRGIQVVGYGHGSSGPEACSEASNGSCAAEWDVGKTCVVFEWSSRIECDWTGSWSDEPTIAKFEGACQVWRCNKQQGKSYRCKNGW